MANLKNSQFQISRVASVNTSYLQIALPRNRWCVKRWNRRDEACIMIICPITGGRRCRKILTLRGTWDVALIKNWTRVYRKQVLRFCRRNYVISTYPMVLNINLIFHLNLTVNKNNEVMNFCFFIFLFQWVSLSLSYTFELL